MNSQSTGPRMAGVCLDELDEGANNGQDSYDTINTEDENATLLMESDKISVGSFFMDFACRPPVILRLGQLHRALGIA